MNSTKNYGLKKPEVHEYYDVNVQNENMEIIDRELKDAKDVTDQIKSGSLAKNGLYLADGYGRVYSDASVTQVEQFKYKKDSNNRRQLIVNGVDKKGASAIVISDWENGKQELFSVYGDHYIPTPDKFGAESMSALPDITNSTTLLATIKAYYNAGIKSGRFFSPDNVPDNPESNWSFGIEFFDCGRSIVLVRAYKTQVYMTYYRQINVETGEYLYDWVCGFNTGNKPTPNVVEAITYGTQRAFINENEDLNTYFICGGYKCINNSTVGSLKICPVDTAFTLDVLSGTGATDRVDVTLYSYIVQFLRTLSGEMWYRGVNSNASDKSIVYGEWKQVATHGSIPLNNNLLINSNFANPVNQRGNTVYNVDAYEMYTIDRWFASGSDVTVGAGYINVKPNNGTLSAGVFSQYIEVSGSEVLGKKLAISFETFYGVHKYVVTLPASVTTTYSSEKYYFGNGHYSYVNVYTNGTIQLLFVVPSELYFKWAKVEVGSVATPYVAKTYSEEFLHCQRFYQKRSVKDAVLLRIGSDYLRFAVSLPHRMRVTPTVDLSKVVVLKNNSATGLNFVIEAQNSEEGVTEIVCVNYDTSGNRISLGLTISDFPALSSEIYLDAEI